MTFSTSFYRKEIGFKSPTSILFKSKRKEKRKKQNALSAPASEYNISISCAVLLRRLLWTGEKWVPPRDGNQFDGWI